MVAKGSSVSPLHQASPGEAVVAAGDYKMST